MQAAMRLFLRFAAGCGWSVIELCQAVKGTSDEDIGRLLCPLSAEGIRGTMVR
jgi:hypothetical protein